MGYTKESIDRVKEAVDMVELVGARSDLRRVGARWTGLCPFHDERTPSFSVNAENKLYHCFGCQESGDAIDFVQATEGLDFREAVEVLAERYNVELKREQEDPEAEARRERRQRLLALVERTTKYYERVLWESPEAAKARDYLAGRGLGDEVLKQFRVGYAPSAWDKVMLAAQRDGFSREELAAAGLGSSGRGGSGFYDRFRARIMFPLADPRGKVLGFGARSMRDDQGPKYVNTSENDLYRKGRQLFGIDHARGPAARAGRVVAVEGYTDVLALHQAGVEESVAIMGTALTQEQMTGLGQAAGTVYLALDADRAGQDAMLRAARAATEKRLNLLVVDMPEGRDPAELVAEEGSDAFRSRLESAREVPDFAARRVVAAADLARAGGRDEALAQVRPLVAQLAGKPATRDELVRYLSDRLDVPPDYLLAHSPAPVARLDSREDAPRPAAPPQLDAVARSERSFLTMCVSSDLGHEYVSRLSDDHFSSGPLRRVRDHLEQHWSDPLAALPDDDPSLAAAIKDVVMRADETHVSEDVLRLDFLQLELRRVERRLRHAEQDGDLEAQRTLAPERQGLKQQIDELMGATA